VPIFEPMDHSTSVRSLRSVSEVYGDVEREQIGDCCTQHVGVGWTAEGVNRHVDKALRAVGEDNLSARCSEASRRAHCVAR